MSKRKTLRRRRVSILLLFAIILVSGIGFGSKVIKNKKVKTYVKENYGDLIEINKDGKDIGEPKSKIDYDKNILVAAHYPSLGNKEIDSDIENTVKSYIDTFKEENKDYDAKELANMKTLHIDYETSGYKDKVNSIKFKIDENNKDERIKTTVYRLDDAKKLSLNDFLIDESLPYISSQAIGQFASIDSTKKLMEDKDIVNSLKNDIKNYINFMVDDKGVELVLPQISKEESVFIAMDDIEMYMKVDPKDFTELSKEEIDEKIANAERGHKIRPGLDPNKPMVALTYDDGPSANATAAILDKLREHNSAATFFVLGQNASIHKDLIKRMADEGHEIGNHSYSHKQLTKLSVEGLNKEVNDTQKIISDIVGYEPALLRPTYGAINDTVKNHVPMPLMLWSIDTLDWKYRNADRVTSSILNNVKDGDIVLMHDLYDSTKDASLRVIPELVNKGYQLVTLSEMYELKGEELKAGERYTNIK